MQCSTATSGPTLSSGCAPSAPSSSGQVCEPITSRQLGVLMAVGAAVAIGAGALRAGLLLLILTALPDVLDGAVAKASGHGVPAWRVLRLGR